MNPICFALLPFGKKLNAAGLTVDFDAVYSEVVAPAITGAGLEPLRADRDMTGDIICKPAFERFILCRYAVADLTIADAKAFYELGLRRAARPWTTVMIFAEGGLDDPFVSSLKALPYKLNDDGSPASPAEDTVALAARLAEAKKMEVEGPATDRPIFELLEDFKGVAHTKTDVFRDQVRYSAEMKERLSGARSQGVEALRAFEQEFSPVSELEAGVVIDLFLSYRAVRAWGDMISLAGKMSRPLAHTVMAQEQLAFALNRAGRGEEAEQILNKVIERRGPSSETYALLGRVYKDRWEAALKAGETILAQDLLDKAIEAYLRGFEADWRDGLPGMNVVTLMELREPPDPRRKRLIPVIAYAVERRIASGRSDYWDHASLIELAVLDGEEQKARAALRSALARVREVWEPETTARNLRLIRETRERRDEACRWALEIEEELSRRENQ